MSFNTSSNQHFEFTATILTITTMILSTLTIIFDSTVLIRLFYCLKVRKGSSKNSQRIGLIYTVNTYFYIIGGTTIFLIMSIRTLYGDMKILNKIDSPASWHCRLLNYFFGIFSAGIYGPSFLHSLFSYWRITKPHKRLFRKFAFHLQLIIIYWMSIMIISIPIWIRSVYIPSENYCFYRYGDIYSSIIVPTIFVTIPVFGIIMIYLKIFLYIKNNWQPRKVFKKIKKNRSTIRRLILFVIVVLTIGLTATVIWYLALSQRSLHFLSYRLLSIVCQIGLLTCSITILIASRGLGRALRSRRYNAQRQQKSFNSESCTNTNESIRETIELKTNCLLRSTNSNGLMKSTIEK